MQPELGNRIRDRRQAKNMSQTALAEAIGVTNVWLCYVEKGHVLPSLPMIIAIADRLGVGVGRLLE